MLFTSAEAALKGSLKAVDLVSGELGQLEEYAARAGYPGEKSDNASADLVLLSMSVVAALRGELASISSHCLK